MESSDNSDNIRSEVEDLKGKVNEMSSTMKNIESLLSTFVMSTPSKPNINTSTSSLSPSILASGLKDDVDLVDEEAKIDGDNDEDESDTHILSGSKLYYQTPAPIKIKPPTRRVSIIDNSPTKFVPREVLYTAPLPSHAHIELKSLKLMPAFIFFEEITKWEEKHFHPLQPTRLMSENVLNLLRDELRRESSYRRVMVASVHTLSADKVKSMIQQLVQPVTRTDYIQ